MAQHRPIFELQQPSSPCSPALVVHALLLGRELLTAYDKTCASCAAAAQVPLIGGTCENVVLFVEALAVLCDFTDKTSHPTQLDHNDKPAPGDKEYAGQHDPLIKSSDLGHDLIIACVLKSLRRMQFGRCSNHGVGDHLMVPLLCCAIIHIFRTLQQTVPLKPFVHSAHLSSSQWKIRKISLSCWKNSSRTLLQSSVSRKVSVLVRVVRSRPLRFKPSEALKKS
ncbi:hypothetical protein V5799_012019 [Amblyomma americanum]|uniref:Uncharacterized protein n=1 Tax=Amblyomma americanum TaxID=6943 RepID=A0AAQ4EF81_AMBAM